MIWSFKVGSTYVQNIVGQYGTDKGGEQEDYTVSLLTRNNSTVMGRSGEGYSKTIYEL